MDLLGIWERDLLARPDYADAICVLNEAVRDRLCQAGRPAKDVRVTGNPAFDTLRDPAMVEAARPSVARRDGTTFTCACMPHRRIPRVFAGVAGTGDPAFPRRVEQVLVESVVANPGLALWVRRHPSEAPAVE